MFGQTEAIAPVDRRLYALRDVTGTIPATALIAAAFLFQFGTGPIKGFAVTLVMGLIANIFASYFVSKFLFEWILGKRAVTTEQFSI